MTSALFVHGAWHGGWCWEAVTALLEGDVRTVDLPTVHAGGAFADDVAAVRAVLDDMDGPVALVGHSYGGAVISEAGTHPNVGHVVVVAGFALDAGETVLTNAAADDPVASAAPQTALPPAMRTSADGLTISVDPEGARVAFYADCDAQPVERLRAMSFAAFTDPVTEPAWRSKPSTYVLCTQDQALHPDMQRFFARRCGTTVELDASHSPMLSMPDRVAAIVRGATK